jgi:hypothetical protein
MCSLLNKNLAMMHNQFTSKSSLTFGDQFVEQTGRKEQLESGKSGEKGHNKGENVGRDMISK